MPNSKPYTKTLLCLANSFRPDGHCFAGKEFVNGVTGRWIRPINAAHHNAVSDEDRRYENATLADVMDIVTVPLQASELSFCACISKALIDSTVAVRRSNVAAWRISEPSELTVLPHVLCLSSD